MRGAAFGVVLALLACGSAKAATDIPQLPARIADAKAAVPAGWTQELAARGDLNGDGRPDLALVLRGDDPASIHTDANGVHFNENPRLLAVYFAQSKDGFRLAMQDHQLIPVKEQTDDDPIDGIAAGGVTIEHDTLRVTLGSFAEAVGSTAFTFRWQKDRFVLIGYDSNFTRRTDNTVTTDSYNYLTARWKHTVKQVTDDTPKVTWTDLPHHRLEALSEVGDGSDFDPLAPPPLPETAWNWADEDISGLGDGSDLGLHASQKICAGLRDLRPPAGDIPGSGGGIPSAGCNSEALYYGIGMKADPVKARACAFYEVGRQNPFAGLGILMSLYANGKGVKRNLDLATALACRIEGAPAELAGRVQHLQAMKADPAKAGTFDYCDDITSGYAGALCEELDANIADTKRNARIDAITAHWSKADIAAFNSLGDAAETYAEVSSDNEVDMSGTARGAFAIQRREDTLDAFAHTLASLENGTLPHATAADAQAADGKLNGLYRKIMALHVKPDQVGGYQSADSLPSTTVTHAGIRKAERAWIAYRDAWLALAARHYPDISPARLSAYLTRERIAYIADFAEAH